MPRIALLSETVASQVAAGEVVERPASVVKELVENSIDAEAKRIEVLVRKGGISHIRIVDDGIGMDRDDALLCLERHATSKIRTGNDLSAIRTLGFRGEALPSIASVSRFRLSTRERDALVGTEVVVNGGKIESVRDGGDAPGTQIEVRSLFYNLPARRKFLRTENTEAHHVEHQMHLQAIGHPEVGFTFVNDDRLVYQLPPTTHLHDRIRDLCGVALANELLEVPEVDYGDLKIRGFLAKAGISRSTRQQQLVFLNGRAVENVTISHALREGYHTALMKGQYPVTFLFLDLDPAAVDVNVHPAKREVRFRNNAYVREGLVEAVRRTLESDRGSWSQTFRASPAPLPVTAPDPIPETLPLIPEREQTALRRDWTELPIATQPSVKAPASVTPEKPVPVPSVPGAPPTVNPDSPVDEPIAAKLALSLEPPKQVEPPSTPSPRPDQPAQGGALTHSPQDFRILGVLGKLYVLMENASGLVLVDQHAAHERILFEEMLHRMEQQGVPTQRLLFPITLQVPPKDADWIVRHVEVLQKAGIAIEPFGAGTFKIDALPTFLRAAEPSQALRDIIDELRETSAQTSRLRLGEEMIAKTVCRHAVKANDYLREPELIRLIQDLLACELPYCCPHGRPTMIQMSYGELEKKFGRKV
ncbi:DNA mismatch repair endonuclease MutL [Verrucomicrobiota bacterium sgz303538]